VVVMGVVHVSEAWEVWGGRSKKGREAGRRGEGHARNQQGHRLRVRAVLQEGHPWAGLTTYPRLFQAPEGPDLPLRFYSPTFFRRKGVHYPMPEPRLVLESLLRRLEVLASLPAPEGVREALLEKTGVRWFEGKTVRAEADVEAVGFVGRVVYHLPRATEEELAWLWALGRFAFYAGVGAKTSLGLGRVKVFSPRKEEG
ncbi:CRISPR system precrRNA processing endoribonuclease RAMP protein Cas6, partial [Thermus scotoductus]|uniref:CRISPR system precrRNA processing endoribonuclease RAMP protein Cas6 n=1 Tax=Thermus scotoductus TaxID=37636 RepID=UPI0020A516C1